MIEGVHTKGMVEQFNGGISDPLASLVYDADGRVTRTLQHHLPQRVSATRHL